MFGRQARAERRAQAEADRLFALADRLAKQTGQRPNYQREITAERAARIREQIGEDLVHDARTPSQSPAREPELQGTELDAEIDRLAHVYHEAASNAPDYYRSDPGGAEHRAAYREMHAEADGLGFADPDVGLSYEIDNADELAAERYYEEQAERHYRERGEHEPVAGLWEYGPDAATWSPEQASAQTDGPGYLYGAPVVRDGGYAVASDVVAEPGTEQAPSWRSEVDAPGYLYGAPERSDWRDQVIDAARQPWQPGPVQSGNPVTLRPPAAPEPGTDIEPGRL